MKAIKSTLFIFINWLVFILIVHFLLKHFLLYKENENKMLNNKEEFSEYCNSILHNCDNSPSKDMKQELQKYIDDHILLDKKRDTDENNVNGFDEISTNESSANFSDEKTDLTDLVYTKKKNIKNKDPVINQNTKKNKLNNDFNNPNMWLYEDENIMNGGNINDNLVAYDNFNDGYASFDDNNIITKC